MISQNRTLEKLHHRKVIIPSILQSIHLQRPASEASYNKKTIQRDKTEDVVQTPETEVSIILEIRDENIFH